jgi:hypothetical protein
MDPIDETYKKPKLRKISFYYTQQFKVPPLVRIPSCMSCGRTKMVVVMTRRVGVEGDALGSDGLASPLRGVTIGLPSSTIGV